MNDEEYKKEVERLRAIGSLGGLATKKKIGKKGYKSLGSKGGNSRWKRD